MQIKTSEYGVRVKSKNQIYAFKLVIKASLICKSQALVAVRIEMLIGNVNTLHQKKIVSSIFL